MSAKVPEGVLVWEDSGGTEVIAVSDLGKVRSQEHQRLKEALKARIPASMSWTWSEITAALDTLDPSGEEDPELARQATAAEGLSKRENARHDAAFQARKDRASSNIPETGD